MLRNINYVLWFDQMIVLFITYECGEKFRLALSFDAKLCIYYSGFDDPQLLIKEEANECNQPSA